MKKGKNLIAIVLASALALCSVLMFFSQTQKYATTGFVISSVGLVFLVAAMVSAKLDEKFTKSRILEMTCLWMSPLFMALMVFVPMDFLTSILWLGIFGILIVSIGKIPRVLIKIVRKEDALSIKLLSPVMCIVLFFVVVKLHGMSEQAADDLAIKTAEEAHALCNSKGECPGSVEGFMCKTEGYCNAREGRFGTTYPVFYSRSDDGKSFRIAVRHNIDKYLIIRGGVGEEINSETEID